MGKLMMALGLVVAVLTVGCPSNDSSSKPPAAPEARRPDFEETHRRQNPFHQAAQDCDLGEKCLAKELEEIGKMPREEQLRWREEQRKHRDLFPYHVYAKGCDLGDRCKAQDRAFKDSLKK